MHDARRLGQQARQRDQHGAGEQRIAPRVVGIIAGIGSVEPRPVKVERTLHEQHARRAGGHRRDRLVDAGRLGARPDGDREARAEGLELDTLANDCVQRHEDRDRNSRRRLILGEAGHRFAKSAGARVRRELPRQVNYRRRRTIWPNERRRWRGGCGRRCRHVSAASSAVAPRCVRALGCASSDIGAEVQRRRGGRSRRIGRRRCSGCMSRYDDVH